MKHVVLVTGGSGFLGQHVVKHLQLYGENVKEIRVLDVVDYKQKLEFEIKKPMKTFTGSITDNDLVERACRGVDIVLHVASIIDYNQFPNQTILHEVNVKGTHVILNACRKENVPYLIYCSSSSLYLGPEEVIDGTETSVSQPSRFYYKAYASSKAKAQDIVLSANGSKLNDGNIMRTLAILPLPMFGELDNVQIPLAVRPFKGKTFPLVGPMDATVQFSYVGNTAMMFVTAAEALPNNSSLGGHFFFAADDTPTASYPETMKPFFNHFGTKTSKWHIPYWIAISMMFVFFSILFILRFLRISLPTVHFSFGSLAFLNTTFYVTYDKAKTMLGYKPFYEYTSSIERAKVFYESII
ncbi:HSD3B [Mytilus coruscus]|uniref:HSD3B n=1 Tax=Mytilus coruscus TaxID=42192 RepID=A0A6J8B4H4_MYTCO|nr:HSD3B [Mytilus coruscus]